MIKETANKMCRLAAQVADGTSLGGIAWSKPRESTAGSPEAVVEKVEANDRKVGVAVISEGKRKQSTLSATSRTWCVGDRSAIETRKAT